MRAEVVAGYDRSGCDVENEEYSFVLIKVLAEPTGGSENRVSYIDYNGMSDRESKLFVERSPPNMDRMEKVFNLIKETESLGIISGGLQEVRIKCENKIEILEDRTTLIDQEKGKIYYDNNGAGTSMKLEKWNEKKFIGK